MKLLQLLVFISTCLSCVNSRDLANSAIPSLNPQGEGSVNCKAKICQDNLASHKTRCQYQGSDKLVVAWGDNPCLARKNLEAKLCQNNTPSQPHKISCLSDPSAGECPRPTRFCSFERKPTACRYTYYNKKRLAWNHQPVVRALNFCVAKVKLDHLVCKKSLIPSLMSGLDCQPDRTEGQCNDLPSCSANDKPSPSVCEVNSYGRRDLKPSWKTEGATVCLARSKIIERACQYANDINKLKPSQLGDIKCRKL